MIHWWLYLHAWEHPGLDPPFRKLLLRTYNASSVGSQVWMCSTECEIKSSMCAESALPCRMWTCRQSATWIQTPCLPGRACWSWSSLKVTGSEQIVWSSRFKLVFRGPVPSEQQREHEASGPLQQVFITVQYWHHVARNTTPAFLYLLLSLHLLSYFLFSFLTSFFPPLFPSFLSYSVRPPRQGLPNVFLLCRWISRQPFTEWYLLWITCITITVQNNGYTWVQWNSQMFVEINILIHLYLIILHQRSV